MAILAVTTGRADATPLGPVIDALGEEGMVVKRLDLEGMTGPEIMGSMAPAAGKSSFWPWLDAECVLVLGDRWELLGPVWTATVGGIPIVHIHGGESTFGAFDNQIRDAITKLSHLHFVATARYAMRLVKDLGEDPNNVFVAGSPGLDRLANLPPRKPEKYFVCTFHPVTLTEETVERMLLALRGYPDYQRIWTGANNDPGSDCIHNAVSVDASHNSIERHLSPDEYIRLCRNAAAVVGNSSSGIIEAPTMEVPSVDIGRRQEGRMRGRSVFHADNGAYRIRAAIEHALAYEGPFDNPYGGPGASKTIAAILKHALAKGISRVKTW